MSRIMDPEIAVRAGEPPRLDTGRERLAPIRRTGDGLDAILLKGTVVKIKNVAPEKLIPYEHNPRTITEAAVDAVAKSIEDAGFRQPVVVDSAGVIIIGHTRTLAAMKLGLKTVPVHVAAELTDLQAKTLRLNDNKTGEKASWDQMILGMEISDLTAQGLDLTLLTFEDHELERLLDVGDDFEPNLNPGTAGGMGVDDNALGKAGDNQKMGERSKQILVEVTCPECAAEFYLQPEDMKG